MGAPLESGEAVDPVLGHGQAALTSLSAAIVELRARAQHRRAERMTEGYRVIARALSEYRGEVKR